MALVSVEEIKAYLGLSNSQLQVQGLRVLVEPGPVSATVQVKATSIEFVIVGGANPGTYTWSLIDPLYATLTLLSVAMNASVADITCEVIAPGASDSNDLITQSATNCLGESNAQNLLITNNYLLSQIADRVSDMAERYCDVEYENTTISERYDGDGTAVLMLDNRPVNSVTRVSTSIATGIIVSNGQTTATAAYVTVDSTTLTLALITGGSTVTSPFTLATYPTMTALAAAINALGSGWLCTIATPRADYSPTDLSVRERSYCLNVACQLELFVDGLSDYILYPEKGWIVLRNGYFPAGYQNVFVTYNYGYAVIPGALKQAVLSLVSLVYFGSRTDPTLQSERLGDHSWSKASGVLVTDSFNKTLESSLALWRRFEIVTT